MASRYSSYGVLDYCYHPVELIQDNGEHIFVPCLKCNGCLLHKANVWASRVSLEIENNPFSIFFTLTYSNKYLPTLKREKLVNGFYNDYVYFSNHEGNIRFDGVEDTIRKDDIFIRGFGDIHIPITNSQLDYPNYFSKRDFQLWLKKLRKDIYLNLRPYDSGEFFRYYAVSECGPTTKRWHLHGILFPKNREIAEFLIHESMFKNWQMCDKVRFDEYVSYCDRNTSAYVSNYVTSYSSLHPIYQGTSVKPFRLSSKSPAIGFSSFDKTQVFEDVSRGVFEFSRDVRKPEQSPLALYPSSYMSRLFPKCYQFASLSYSRLLYVYGYIYREVNGYDRPYILLSERLRKELHASDFEAMSACYNACNLLGCVPDYYLYLLDLYYSKRALRSLAQWYTWQEANADKPFKILSSYLNLNDYVANKISYEIVLRYFFEGFGLTPDDLDRNMVYVLKEKDSLDLEYQNDVDNIVSNLQKLPKFNELIKQI